MKKKSTPEVVVIPKRVLLMRRRRGGAGGCAQETSAVKRASIIDDAALRHHTGGMDRARSVLQGRLEERHGGFYLDGTLTRVGLVLKAANAEIGRLNEERPPRRREPLIGRNHHAWEC